MSDTVSKRGQYYSATGNNAHSRFMFYSTLYLFLRTNTNPHIRLLFGSTQKETEIISVGLKSRIMFLDVMSVR